MFTLSGDNVHYQPLLSTFNEKAKIKKYDHNISSDMTKQTILSSHRAKTRDILDIRLVSVINVLGARIKKWMVAHRAIIADGKYNNSCFYTFRVISLGTLAINKVCLNRIRSIALERFKLGSLNFTQVSASFSRRAYLLFEV